ncbi:MAG: ATP-binding cassette domain-containing protein, partial [Alphaproteobacteria bacterium]
MTDHAQPHTPRNEAVEARNITRQYVRGSFTALDDITLTLRENEIVSFIGPSGCGKTTMLRLI